MDLVTAKEDAAQIIHSLEAGEEYRWRARTAIEGATRRWVKPNISKEEYRSLKNPKTDASLKIVPADKGYSIVVIDGETYKEKLQKC